MKLINIITRDLLITKCYLEKCTNDISAIKKEKFTMSYVDFKIYKLKFLYKYSDGTKIYQLIEKEN
ncbi:hypothetical protein [uncultured Clostridium sp.]|uniref:hypothetical protein n=1 Tax=uncultured Clostridium sp. TaxID=59620 RepID=UPI00262971EA|nr:hypothetical protein [uncultured Clostridium sp.]